MSDVHYVCCGETKNLCKMCYKKQEFDSSDRMFKQTIFNFDCIGNCDMVNLKIVTKFQLVSVNFQSSWVKFQMKTTETCKEIQH